MGSIGYNSIGSENAICRFSIGDKWGVVWESGWMAAK